MTNTLGPIGVKQDRKAPARFAISIDDLREKYSYDADTGWVIFRSGPRWGERAGTVHGDGYRRVYIHGRQISSGPVCWALVMGHWSKNEIDHIDRDKLNDVWVNLREVSRSDNLRNRKYAASGKKGVYLDRGRWKSSVFENGKNIHLGYFPTVEQASEAYLAYRGGEL